MNAYANYDRAEYDRDTKELQQIFRDEEVREMADEFDGLFPENLSNFTTPFNNPSFLKIISNSRIQELYARFVDDACVILAEDELTARYMLSDGNREAG